MKRRAKLCREHRGAYIPPSWLKPEEAKAFVRQVGLPTLSVR